MATAVAASSDEDDCLALTKRLEMAEVLSAKAAIFRSEGKIQGMQRIEKQIKAEITMLQKLLNGIIQVKKHHVHSTNLLHLESVLHICEYATNVTAVDRAMKHSNRLIQQLTTIDVISNGGSMWIKLFARKRSALHKKWQGDGNFGEKTVSDFADEYIQASKQNPHNFLPPRITFVFFDGVTESIAEELQETGINVVGPIYPDDSEESAPTPLQIAMLFRQSTANGGPSVPTADPITIDDHDRIECDSVNLDVSSMLAWVSLITHSKDFIEFNDKLLQEQAIMERQDPLWPKLQAATKGKELIACETAVKDFKSIVMCVGGTTERDRAKELLSAVRLVPDQPSDRAIALRKTGKVKDRPKVIFGTGDQLKAATLTANEGFVRSANGQGVRFSVILHPSRALAEAELEKTEIENLKFKLNRTVKVDNNS